VADSWNQVRIGGALGGDSPGDTLKRGSIAILSNSGGFTTTIAQYLRMGGWGTTTLVSSGKDVYIHYAAPEFAFALGNDDRSKAAVLYCEPGGYYELDAEFTKPGGGLRGRPLEEQAHARGRPCRRDVRRG
jgi:succinyl-CoA synthetase alpha subunit